MSLTAEDIQTQQFHVRFRGFDVDEVDAFLERVAENFVLLKDEKRQLKEQVEKWAEPDVKGRVGVTEQVTTRQASIVGVAQQTEVYRTTEGRQAFQQISTDIAGDAGLFERGKGLIIAPSAKVVKTVDKERKRLEEMRTARVRGVEAMEKATSDAQKEGIRRGLVQLDRAIAQRDTRLTDFEKTLTKASADVTERIGDSEALKKLAYVPTEYAPKGAEGYSAPIKDAGKEVKKIQETYYEPIVKGARAKFDTFEGPELIQITDVDDFGVRQSTSYYGAEFDPLAGDKPGGAYVTGVKQDKITTYHRYTVDKPWYSLAPDQRVDVSVTRDRTQIKLDALDRWPLTLTQDGKVVPQRISLGENLEVSASTKGRLYTLQDYNSGVMLGLANPDVKAYNDAISTFMRLEGAYLDRSAKGGVSKPGSPRTLIGGENFVHYTKETFYEPGGGKMRPDYQRVTGEIAPVRDQYGKIVGGQGGEFDITSFYVYDESLAQSAIDEYNKSIDPRKGDKPVSLTMYKGQPMALIQTESGQEMRPVAWLQMGEAEYTTQFGKTQDIFMPLSDHQAIAFGPSVGPVAEPAPDTEVLDAEPINPQDAEQIRRGQVPGE